MNIDKSDWVYVIAGSHVQAMNFAREHGVDPRRLIYIAGPRDLRGISGLGGRKIYLVGTWRTRYDVFELAELAQQRGFKVTPTEP